jgi:hypothetical protein
MANFSSSDRAARVIDTSVAISLEASGIADAVFGLFERPALMVDIARDELDGGRGHGVKVREAISVWESRGLVSIVRLEESAYDMYEALIAGVATLDDGEAATIAHALDIDGIAVLDEARARNTSIRRFPALPLSSAAGLLLTPALAAGIGTSAVADALFAALKHSRMRVPAELQLDVVRLIGDERAALCNSLPAAVRIAVSRSA